MAHEAGSDIFLVAMTAPARAGSVHSSPDCRAVMERIALALRLGVELRTETGWTVLREIDGPAALDAGVEGALERGARERERYEFFAAVGHELRTPLTSIRGYLETLLETPVDEQTARRFLETARREALRMGRLIEGMFEFSLLDLSGQSLLGASCEVDAQIDQACEIVRPLAQQRGMSLERGPLCAARIFLEADAFLQMLVNLLDNAVKYGKPDGCARICAAIQGEELVVSIDDDGPGVTAGERNAIFGLRVRGEQRDRWAGTGIGLAIVKMIADRAGGRIECARSPLGGARFEIVLPVGAESARSAS